MVPLNPACPERLAKVRRYLEKRKNRKWIKKVSYVCRRATAEKRLRIKGRFVKNSDQINILNRVTGATQDQPLALSQSDGDSE